ncbi:hypothetical protein ACXN5S_07670 [Pseudoroseicyclus sp. H15]
MSRVATLHIGMHKTGTTTLQHRLAGYDDGETKYLDLGYPNHSIPLKLAYLDNPPKAFYASDDEAAWPAEREAARKRIAKALRDAAPANVVISGEELSTFPNGPFRPRLISHLRRQVDEVKVIGYVRDPAGFMASEFGQRVQAGFRQFNLLALYPRYRFRFFGWNYVMERAGNGFDLSLYDPASYENGDVVNDFVARAGLDPSHLRDVGAKANPSLTAEGAAVFYAFRHADGPSPVRGEEHEAQIKLINLMYGFGRNPIRLDPEAIQPLLAENAEEIDWIQELIGRPFPAPKLGPVMFSDSRQIIRYARGLGPELAEWLHEQGYEPANSGRSVPGLMRGMVMHFLEIEDTFRNRMTYRLDVHRRLRELKRQQAQETKARKLRQKQQAREQSAKAEPLPAKGQSNA